jgi:transposase
MPRTRPPYPPEFRQQMVDLVRAGRKPGELAAEFGCTAQSVANWVAQAQRDTGERKDGLSSAERDELVRLRRENKQLRTEREILSKAAAWFANETGTTSKKSSGS